MATVLLPPTFMAMLFVPGRATALPLPLKRHKPAPPLFKTSPGAAICTKFFPSLTPQGTPSSHGALGAYLCIIWHKCEVSMQLLRLQAGPNAEELALPATSGTAT